MERRLTFPENFLGVAYATLALNHNGEFANMFYEKYVGPIIEDEDTRERIARESGESGGYKIGGFVYKRIPKDIFTEDERYAKYLASFLGMPYKHVAPGQYYWKDKYTGTSFNLPTNQTEIISVNIAAAILLDTLKYGPCYDLIDYPMGQWRILEKMMEIRYNKEIDLEDFLYMSDKERAICFPAIKRCLEVNVDWEHPAFCPTDIINDIEREMYTRAEPMCSYHPILKFSEDFGAEYGEWKNGFDPNFKDMNGFYMKEVGDVHDKISILSEFYPVYVNVDGRKYYIDCVARTIKNPQGKLAIEYKTFGELQHEINVIYLGFTAYTEDVESDQVPIPPYDLGATKSVFRKETKKSIFSFRLRDIHFDLKNYYLAGKNIELSRRGILDVPDTEKAKEYWPETTDIETTYEEKYEHWADYQEFERQRKEKMERRDALLTNEQREDLIALGVYDDYINGIGVIMPHGDRD